MGYVTPVVSRSFGHHQVTVLFSSVPPQLRGRTLWGWSKVSHLSSPSINLMKGLAARQLFRVPPCYEDAIHLQTSTSSPGFELSPYTTAVSIANHYTGWATFFQVGTLLLRKVTNFIERCWLIMEPVQNSSTRVPCMSKSAVNITFGADC
ncbi:hypothetical protein TNCV_2124761 [Trichonephila clavipes]|uniref:Uncharacterized protein n=1 Tax=Trichonephila clavipes TaxID=2585209 RepID=A0A8X6R6D6_TRICX|nr:hypothetical protein TNCV_2124761 [Trichonephila clavipes]